MGYKEKWYSDKNLLKLYLVDKGCSIEETALTFGVSAETIRMLAKRYGIRTVK